ncbi:hypothetical protein DY000_02002296 [Brassica cretica]|uniref:Uncharacterized protein n=1 Tax=Brassica cretica TaxID=69181 RepID=A0ABQ7C406_BRACR|nr:hypothetical protein DY000_02002296 [Brassica cretica]
MASLETQVQELDQGHRDREFHRRRSGGELHRRRSGGELHQRRSSRLRSVVLPHESFTKDAAAVCVPSFSPILTITVTGFAE